MLTHISCVPHIASWTSSRIVVRNSSTLKSYTIVLGIVVLAVGLFAVCRMTIREALIVVSVATRLLTTIAAGATIRVSTGSLLPVLCCVWIGVKAGLLTIVRASVASMIL